MSRWVRRATIAIEDRRFFEHSGGFAPDEFGAAAAETLATTNRVVIAGEVRTSLDPEKMKALVEQAARAAIKDIGYEQDGFHWKNAIVECHVHSQSADIAVGVDVEGAEVGPHALPDAARRDAERLQRRVRRSDGAGRRRRGR